MSNFGRPLKYPAGTEFDYGVWTPGTMVQLMNVPWNSNYDGVVDFATPEERDAYFRGETILEIEGVTYIKPNQPVKLSVPYGYAQQFNYMVVRNPAQPVKGDLPTEYFYFVRDVVHYAPDTTEFVLQLDVWATYINKIKIHGGFLNRGHYGMWRSHQDKLPRVNNFALTPEGLDTGATYSTGNVQAKALGVDLNNVDYLISSTISLVAAPGTKADPNNPTTRGGRVLTVNTATETYLVEGGNLPSYMQGMEQYSWIARGIFRVVAVPQVDKSNLEAVTQNTVNGKLYPPAKLYRLNASQASGATAVYPIENWPDIDDAIAAALTREYGPNYTWMDKFKTYPYSYLTIGDGTGPELVIKPQELRDDNVELSTLASFLPGSEEVRIVWRNSLAGDNGTPYALSITDLPTLATVNDSAAIAVASQARSIQSAREGASWAHQKAMMGNSVGAANATIGMDAAWDSANVARSADSQQTAIGNNAALVTGATNAAGSIGMGMVGGGMAGGPAGAALGLGMGAGGALAGAMATNANIVANNASLGVRSQASVQNSQIAYGAAGSIRDNNKGLADIGAQGDYANTIGAINASVQDTMMTPASMSGQIGGAAAAWAMSANQGIKSARGLYGHVHTITRDVIARIGEFWAMYGYATNRYVTFYQFSYMTHWTYWQMTNLKVTGVPGLNENHLNTIRGIFERGVTIYRKPEYVNTIHPSENRVM